MALKLHERRRYIRIEVPLKVKITGEGWTEEVATKNISPIGMRFETGRRFRQMDVLGLEVYLPADDISIDLKGKVIWQEKTSLEDNALYDVGIEIIEIKEEHKNALLKYLCDLLYDSSYHSG